MITMQVPEALVEVFQEAIRKYEATQKTEGVSSSSLALVPLPENEKVQAKWRELAYKPELLTPEERKYLVQEINAVILQVKMMDNARKLLADKYGPAMQKLGLKRFEDLANFLKKGASS